jgi:hypothetical protein
MSNIRGLFSDRRSDDDDDSDDGNDRFVGGIGDRGGGRQVVTNESDTERRGEPGDAVVVTYWIVLLAVGVPMSGSNRG